MGNKGGPCSKDLQKYFFFLRYQCTNGICSLDHNSRRDVTQKGDNGIGYHFHGSVNYLEVKRCVPVEIESL